MTAFDNATKRNIPASSLGWIFDRIIGLQNFLCANPRLLIDNGIMFTFVNNCSFVIYLSDIGVVIQNAVNRCCCPRFASLGFTTFRIEFCCDYFRRLNFNILVVSRIMEDNYV